MTSIESLPAEIFLELATYLSSRSDVLQLSQVSTSVYAKVIPALYADVDLHGAEQCERTLGMIERCPEVARHVRRLTVHPEHELSPRPRDQYRAWDNAGVVSRCVMRAARNLDALHDFEWDGEDMLPDDRMWAELRARCPCLKRVGTTFGCFLPRPTSNLFQFSDLVGFALTFKDGFYAHSLHVPSRGGLPGPHPLLLPKDQHVRDRADAEAESEPVFTRLWDMLTLRCPALEALCVVGHSSEPSEAARLYAARWPKLRSLTLGALVWNTNAPDVVSTAPDFKEFLEAHPTIESLHLLGKPSANQLDISALDHSALPNLTEFSGSFNHLRMLVDRTPSLAPDDPQAQNPNANPNPPAVGSTTLTKTLQRVCFPHAMHLRDLTPLTVSRVLMSLHGLTSLKVTFAIQGGYDSNGILRTIVASCPHLLDLDITCTTKPSFFLDAFANVLRGLTRLRTLALSLVRMPGEEPMHIGASRIALANPRLQCFSVAFIPTHPSADATVPPLERGTFELACDTHGIPICMRVAQWHTVPWLWPWPALWAGAGSLPLPPSLPRAMGAGVGGGVAEWFAAVAGALGVDTPLLLLESRARTFGLDSGEGADGATARKSGRRARVRRWVCDLRPSGHPDVVQKGLGALLVERSPAGEEARLMAFCLCLLVLTVWALVSKAMREAVV
ncbi:uncharacterized protein TRAVEDRAFT_56411 [Trametes versicolor FP-101664 SS1]|uniref:uncharacterized protein n=1 Tax=Trametes versicolor (strain FP-101664) TaxID=717944 RepID=UPI0004623FC4|nr:uncharacterized protein TRAVEDRAFT_56411 [Trametes versicolor FP-101664 SS1]EIW63382.1 hypothetical protein TRAVEDRAFT_56411 [Trametes versicolor FP-101664 SS1]